MQKQNDELLCKIETFYLYHTVEYLLEPLITANFKFQNCCETGV